MSRLSKQRAKEQFLSNIEPVITQNILDEIAKANNVDLYTYFISKDAFNSDILSDKDLNEIVVKAYADWYFLHKNISDKDPRSVRLLNDYRYTPIALDGDKCFEFIKNGEFKDIIPIYIQYINKLEESYFLCLETHKIYGKSYDTDYNVRLYINLKANSLIAFAREFLDRTYLCEFPALLKILNHDHRNDTITIYTDYEHASAVIDCIEDIKRECPSIFSNVGGVSPLLGKVNDYIGFGEVNDSRKTYFGTRSIALSSSRDIATREVLKNNIVGIEDKIIFRSDSESYTPSEYLAFLIERNALKLIERKIEDIESSGSELADGLDELYEMREDISKGIDISKEVSELKKSLTRNSNYILSIEGYEDEYNYAAKLYRLFSTDNDRVFGRHNEARKLDLICNHIFPISNQFDGIDTRNFLSEYFRLKLAEIISTILSEKKSNLKRTKEGSALHNARKKSCSKLTSILSSIVDDEDEGREYIGRCINDYIRILSTGALEDVEITIDGETIALENTNNKLIDMLPHLQSDIDNLSIDRNYINNILCEFDINIDNICLNKDTKNICKCPTHTLQVEEDRFYYDPDGYISNNEYSKDNTPQPELNA